MYYAALWIAILLSAFGQLAVKAGVTKTAHITGVALSDPYIIMGVVFYFVSLLFYLYSLKQIPVSVAFPCVSVGYIIVAIMAHLLWHEPFGAQHMLALLIILSGVFLLIRA